MARGITENDVWAACDTLLLEGGRPTIERVRQKIGRGSPNTVSPYLDTWFKTLGRRIKDPGAFSAPPEIPDPIQQAAKHFWEAALAETRLDFDQRLVAGMAAAVANVEAEKELASLATAAAFDASSKATRLQTELAECERSLEVEKLARATSEAHLLDARAQIQDARSGLNHAVAELDEVRASTKRDVDAAIERATVAERRAGLEVDAQRIARTKAERRADAFEQKLEAAHVAVRQAQEQLLQSTMEMRAEIGRLSRDVAVAQTANDEATAEIRRLNGLVVAEQLAAERAQGEASGARAALLRFERVIPRKASRKKPLKSASPL